MLHSSLFSWLAAILAALCVHQVSSFAAGGSGSRVQIFKDVQEVGEALCEIVESSYEESVEKYGHFSFAIPGGSILKMLSSLKGESRIDWSKCTMGWVNHRAVPLDDPTSTQFKAQDLFLRSWEEQGLEILALSGTTDAPLEAARYSDILREKVTFANGFPCFDLSLIGMGLDGHIGSLYPESEAVQDLESVVVPVVKPSSSSITLSLPTMLNSREIVVASAGASEKYPLGKAEGVARALGGKETPLSFPGSALAGGRAAWLIDEGAAALLGKEEE
mmetsp:Transcript_7870/g.11926  ORF Transcript_7870/g.11926 Transcript_7870/m.11926 type:complete len:276 (+) Transcript_7870:65-892(+)